MQFYTMLWINFVFILIFCIFIVVNQKFNIMPWKVGSKTRKGWPIKKKVSGSWKTVGHSDTKKKAEASVRARYANK